MIFNSLLTGVILFTSFAMRTPNVQPNPDDYEFSIGLSKDNYYLKRDWERELGNKYIDDLAWYKFENGVYFKPEYMNKQSKDVKYLKLDWRNEFENKFNIKYKFSEKISIYNMGEIYRLKGEQFYKAKVGLEIKL
jgi:hypothetical protein